MRWLLIVALAAAPLSAQVTATLRTAPNRTPEIRLRNDSVVTLAAYAVAVPFADADNALPGIYFGDTILDAGPGPVLPHQEQVLMMFGRIGEEPRLSGPIVTAGIFDDGTTIGDPALLKRIIIRRSNMLQAVEATLDILTDAGSRNVPQREMVGEFQRLADSLNHWYLPAEQTVGRGLYQAMAGKLLNLSAGVLGSPFPPTAFVDREAGVLRRQRRALLDSQPSLAKQ